MSRARPILLPALLGLLLFTVARGQAPPPPAAVRTVPVWCDRLDLADLLPPNAAPVANNDLAVVDEDGEVVIDVLANDTDPDGDPLRVDRWDWSLPNGTVFQLADGRLRYVPREDFCGTEAFTYTATDGRDESARATVTVTARPVNDPPEGFHDAFRFIHDPGGDPDAFVPYHPAELPSVLDNDADVEGAPNHVAEVDTADLVGTIDMDPGGTFAWSGPAGFYGETEFRYRAGDPDGGRSEWVTVKLWALPAPPADDAVITRPDRIVLGREPAVGNVLVNDTGAAYAVLAGRPPAKMVTGFDLDGTIRFAPWSPRRYGPVTYRAYSADGTSAARVGRPGGR